MCSNVFSLGCIFDFPDGNSKCLNLGLNKIFWNLVARAGGGWFESLLFIGSKIGGGEFFQKMT